MVESKVMMRSGTASAEPSLTDPEEGPLLAAALAAALVEYRRHVEQGSDPGHAGGTGTRWRMLARWEQLGGRT
jgi:hypothetical protein